LAEMGGLWRRMRFTGWLMAIGIAAAAGIPPFSTFWSKDTILSKALELGSPPAIVVVTAVTFLGTMALVRIFALLFTGETARRRRGPGSPFAKRWRRASSSIGPTGLAAPRLCFR